jgi:transposase-like protein
MNRRYTVEERQEALKLAAEIGNKATAERLGINLDTLYTWVSKTRERSHTLEAIVREKGPAGLAAECEALKKELREKEHEVEILQEALSFFVKRRKK